MGLIALPVAMSVDQDEAVFRLQCRNGAWLVPNLDAIAKAVLEDERWPAALNSVVDRNALVINIEGNEVRLASIEDIIKLKTGSNRDRDRMHITMLQSLLDAKDAL